MTATRETLYPCGCRSALSCRSQNIDTLKPSRERHAARVFLFDSLKCAFGFFWHGHAVGTAYPPIGTLGAYLREGNSALVLSLLQGFLKQVY